MKKLVRALLVIALPVGVVAAPAAHAATPQLVFTQSTGAPISGTPTYKAGDTAYFMITNFPSTPAEGVYAYEAVQPAAGAKPTQSNPQGAVWISTQAGATFTPMQIISIKIDNGNAWNADCAHQQCGIFVEGAHGTTSAAQQFVPFNFQADAGMGASPSPSASPAATLPKDQVTVLVNGVPLVSNGLSTIHYREILKFVVDSQAKAAISFKSYTPALCPVTATGSVTALKGTGQCDIAVESAATATTAATETHFPFNVVKGVQSLTTPSFSLKAGQSASLATISNFGEKVSYKMPATKNCSLKGTALKAVKVGTCVLTATAPAAANYPAMNQKVVITVTK